MKDSSSSKSKQQPVSSKEYWALGSFLLRRLLLLIPVLWGVLHGLMLIWSCLIGLV
jgi:lipopolysaccharide/colanic/teichoic acid biosynthesis glycosyltransferase